VRCVGCLKGIARRGPLWHTPPIPPERQGDQAYDVALALSGLRPGSGAMTRLSCLLTTRRATRKAWRMSLTNFGVQPDGTSSRATTRLRQMLRSGMMVAAPFVLNAFHAKIAERVGFQALYMTGFGTAAERGYPDVGLGTQTEMVENARYIASAVDKLSEHGMNLPATYPHAASCRTVTESARLHMLLTISLGLSECCEPSCVRPRSIGLGERVRSIPRAAVCLPHPVGRYTSSPFFLLRSPTTRKPPAIFSLTCCGQCR
jgi:hypothetical protein